MSFIFILIQTYSLLNALKVIYIDACHLLIIFTIYLFLFLHIGKPGKLWLPDVEPGEIVDVFYTSVLSSFLCFMLITIVCVGFWSRNDCLSIWSQKTIFDMGVFRILDCFQNWQMVLYFKSLYTTPPMSCFMASP